METLFTPEVIQQFLSILKGATEGSVTVLVVYFLLPVLMLLISSVTALILVTKAINSISECVLTHLSREKVVHTKFILGDHVIESGNLYNDLFRQLERLKSTTYIHSSGVDYLKSALDAYEKENGSLRKC